ncbi:hypothetical protein ULMS_28320 [Patiriisocius marinistellae]|uniref:Uncharacterized protein n=2 Tax=Patiriisocius marinistellae TaxID=2494560 RepID=A0A5J4G155_9FLAO|nr:hypothetical protein ULMS_28320 [Patiriisocius marinistellae]
MTSCIAQTNTSVFNVISEKNGMVGIGTQNPDEKLTVKGTIHTQEVLVDLNGAVAPDYVFDMYFDGESPLKKDYTMMSLTLLESFIAKNHHLPNIPSASTIEEKGLSLKEMNLALLEKVEELTLYTIEQQKEIEALKKAVQSLIEKK